MQGKGNVGKMRLDSAGVSFKKNMAVNRGVGTRGARGAVAPPGIFQTGSAPPGKFLARYLCCTEFLETGICLQKLVNDAVQKFNNNILAHLKELSFRGVLPPYASPRRGSAPKALIRRCNFALLYAHQTPWND